MLRRLYVQVVCDWDPRLLAHELGPSNKRPLDNQVVAHVNPTQSGVVMDGSASKSGTINVVCDLTQPGLTPAMLKGILRMGTKPTSPLGNLWLYTTQSMDQALAQWPGIVKARHTQDKRIATDAAQCAGSWLNRIQV